MKRKHITLLIIAVVVLGIAGLAAYQFTGGREFSSDMTDLKDQFNRDKGKVRLLVLLSPT